MKNFISFINESISDISVGDHVIVNGLVDGLSIDNQEGIVISKTGSSYKIKFLKAFSARLHSEDNMCWNVPNNEKYVRKIIHTKYIDPITLMLLNYKVKDDELTNKRMLYVKHTNQADVLSYLPANRASNIKEDTAWVSKQRQDIKVGKFLKKLFPHYSQDKIHNMVKHYKADYRKYFHVYDMKIVYGEDIRKYYLYKNYDGNGGRLHSSCMRQEDDQYRFDIYVDNPDVCGLLITMSPDKEDKIIARALVWKTSMGMYIDRVYATNDEDIKIYIDYADERGWLCYENNDYRKNMFVQLTSGVDYGNANDNPYMDTFKRYNPDNNTLCSRCMEYRYMLEDW